MKIYCKTNQFPAFSFCGSQSKPHGARGLSKNYHLRFDPTLGHGVYVISCIPCAYVACTSMLDNPWISDIPSNKQERYKPVTNYTNWPVLGSFNNWNIRLVPSQDVHFFYTRSHLSTLQNCALILSINFQFIFTFKNCTTQFRH